MIYLQIDSKLGKKKAQIYKGIREGILDGTIPAESKMPSTREISTEYGVSRSTVVECFEQLIAEGYLYSKKGQGTYVMSGLCRMDSETNGHISKPESETVNYRFCFRTGIPDLYMIPIVKWGKIYHDITLNSCEEHLGYANPVGEISLRRQLASYLNRVRGTIVSEDSLMIVSGMAQGFSLLAGTITKDESVAIEQPCSKGLYETLQHFGIRCVKVPVDEEGICVDKLPTTSPKMIFTTPSHQFPMGVRMSMKRKMELIKYARENDCYIIEDDYDSEFRFEGDPYPSFQGLAPERVIYAGTFSKTFSPAIRLGFLSIPSVLMDKLKREKYISDIHNSVLEQLTMARFIEIGAYEQHIRRMKQIYRKRRDLLIGALTHQFEDRISILGEKAGLHFVGVFKEVEFDENLMERLWRAGIEISSCEVPGTLLFGYGNLKEETIHEAVVELRNVISSASS